MFAMGRHGWMVRVAGWLVGGAAMGVGVGVGPLRAQFPPEKLENLKVFPEDIPVRELIGRMREFSIGLGVRCQYCHVGEPGADLSTFDFPSDEKVTKRKARTMIRMVRDINAQYLPRLDARTDPPLTVSCGTCHRGLSKPMTLTETLARTARESGADSAIAQYHGLREEYYGSGSYDFGEGSLLGAAQQISRTDPEGALKLLQLNLELFPQSVGTHVRLAQVYQGLGNREAAIGHVERALELAPGTPFLEQMLERLRG